MARRGLDPQQTSSTGMVGNAAPLPYGVNPYHHNQMIGMNAPNLAPAPAPGLASNSIQSPIQSAASAQHHLAYQQIHQQQQQQLRQQLQQFWAEQCQEIENITDFKTHNLPLARIKKIMKADEDVRMISAEAPIVFSRACEMFIRELTLRSWSHTEENKRRTLQKNDIAAAITKEDTFDFLVDIVPREDLKDDVLAPVPGIGAPPDALPYYYMAPQLAPQVVARGTGAAEQSSYNQQAGPYIAQQMRSQQQPPGGYR